MCHTASLIRSKSPIRLFSGDRALAEKINWEHGDDHWQPVVFLNEHYGPEDVTLLYRMAAGSVVSSLHDGMNVVAKEFVASRDDDRGVLVLSQFTGAAKELTDAVLVNPFDVDELATGLYLGLTMPVEEQERRMRRMRSKVQDNNIYRWAGMLLSEVGKLVPEPVAPPTPEPIGPTSDSDAIERRIASENFITAMRLAGC